jgi:hypothetical protein
MKPNVYWKLRLIGSLEIERDGETFRPRIVHQSLLLVRLALHHPKPISRAESAELLWPDSNNGLAYLRRAVKELRDAGLPIESKEDLISLPEGVIETDLPINTGSSIPSDLTLNDILVGFDHPIAQEVREAVVEYRSKLAESDLEIVEDNQEKLLHRLVGEQVVKLKPEVAIKLLTSNQQGITSKELQDSLITIGQDLIARSDENSPEVLQLQILMARVARLKTRYQLSERLLESVLSRCKEEYSELTARVVYEYGSLCLECRQWEKAKAFGVRMAKIAPKLPPSQIHALAYNLSAAILWHTAHYQEGAEMFVKAYQHATTHHERAIIMSNLANVWGLHHANVDLPDYEPDGDIENQGLYGRVANTYYRFALAFREKDFRHACTLSAILLELCGKAGLERIFCVALDCAAISLSAEGRGLEARACVRVGTRVRHHLGHLRSPMETDTIRMYVRGPYIGKEVRQMERKVASDELSLSARKLSQLLRKAG